MDAGNLSISKPVPNRFHNEVDLDRMRAASEEFVASAMETLRNEPGVEKYVFEVYRRLADQNTAAIDQLHRQSNPSAGSAPCDLFVSDKLGTADRSATQVGGVPYWPADRPWPTNWRGKPLRFLAQINFADSRDLFPDLPGEILVVFMYRWRTLLPVWLPAGMENLIDADSVPSHDREILPATMAMLRTNDSASKLETGASSMNPLWSPTIKVGGMFGGNPKKAPPRGRLLFQIEGLAELVEETEFCEAETVDVQPFECTEDGCNEPMGCLYFDGSDLPRISGFLMPDGALKIIREFHQVPWPEPDDGYEFRPYARWLLGRIRPRSGLLAIGSLLEPVLFRKRRLHG